MAASPPKDPTLRELAKLCGVSIMTVSNVLRNTGRFSESTRVRVKAAARKLNYRPDPEISRLMLRLHQPANRRNRSTIGLVGTWSPNHSEMVDGYFQRLYQGVVNRADQGGYEVSRFLLGDRMPAERLYRAMRARGIDSMLITPWAKAGAHFNFPWDEMTVAAASNSLWKPKLNRSSPHHHNNMLLALHHARHLGYRRPGLVLRKEHDRASVHAWWSACLWYIETHSNMEKVPVLCEGSITFNTFSNWYFKNKPDLVISTLNFPLDWINRLGHRIPRDVGFISLGGHGGDTPVTEINQRPELIGAAAIDLLISQIHGNEKGLPASPKVVMVEGSWQPGQTTRKQKLASSSISTRKSSIPLHTQ